MLVTLVSLQCKRDRMVVILSCCPSLQEAVGHSDQGHGIWTPTSWVPVPHLPLNVFVSLDKLFLS